MQRDAIFTASLVLALGHASGCSVLFDPEQYSSEDADGLDARATDPDAPDPGEPDAYVEPGADADLDARVAPDSSFDAAFSDAGPDAPPPVFCPDLPTSTTLPTCASPTRLAYCSPEDASVLGFPRETAIAMLGEGTMGHRFGVLGNAIDVADPVPAGSISDQELSRDGETLSIVWAANDGTPRVLRRTWMVGSAALGSPVEFGLTSLRVAQVLDLSTASATDPALTYVGASGPAIAARCSTAMGTCTAAGMAVPPVGRSAWVTTSSLGVVMASPNAPSTRLEFELLGDSRLNGSQNRSMVEPLEDIVGLRPTHIAFAYTLGTGTQVGIDLTTSFALPLRLGTGSPRIAQADTAANGLIGRVTRRSPNLAVATRVLRCPGTEPCDCGGAPCDAGTEESSIPTDLPIVDWSFHNVDRYHRVAVLLLGDSLEGTRVVVAMWSVEGSPAMPIVAPPVVIASGRLGGTPGVGRSIRSVVTRDEVSDRMEVFVTALVSVAGTDHIFLSGMRLLRCGS